MESKQQPAPHQPTQPAPFAGRPAVESKRADLLVRVSILENDRDEEEQEAGYGHGV